MNRELVKYHLFISLILILFCFSGYADEIHSEAKRKVSVTLSNKKDNSTKSGRKSNWDWFLIAIGKESFSGGTDECLNNAFAIQVSEVEYKPPNIKWIKLALFGVDGSFPRHDLNPSERAALREYEKVTTEFGRVIKREPVRGIRYDLGRFSVGPKFYPISAIYEGSIRPFLGIGISLWFFDPHVEGVYMKEKAKIGLGTLYRLGIDFVAKNDAYFFRIEFLSGGVPDFKARVLPEIRQIKGGRFNTFRFGFGIQSPF